LGVRKRCLRFVDLKKRTTRSFLASFSGVRWLKAGLRSRSHKKSEVFG